MRRGAVLAFPDETGEPRARLVLEREAAYGSNGHAVAWLMCNPSRASHLIDDPTAGRVMHHTSRAGYQRALVGNVWPLRTPYPEELWPRIQAGEITPEMRSANLDALAMISAQSSVHVVAIGTAMRRHPTDVAEALEAFTLGGRHPLYCLGTTDDGTPLHPLARGRFAVRNDTVLRPWQPH